jgi:acetyl-CoA acetyltransferase
VVGAAVADLGTAHIDDVILGEGFYGGGVLARRAAITASLASVPGVHRSGHCRGDSEALARTWLSLGDVHAFEFNEAFAAICVPR